MNTKPLREFSDGQGYINSTTLRPSGGRERLHRVVARLVLRGEPSTRWVVHHIDGDGENNANNNLCILQNHSEHKRLHHRLSIIRAGGHPFKDVICDLCRKVAARKTCVGDGQYYRHRSCHADYMTKKYGTGLGRWPTGRAR
jgi:hypothetical protein